MSASKTVRTIKTIHRELNNDIAVGADFNSWLVEQAVKLRSANAQANQHALNEVNSNLPNETHDVYLLSFHDDGVVWGKLKNGALIISAKGDISAPPQTPSPKFRADTLQELRLFSERGELLVWRSGSNDFKARLIQDFKESEINKPADTKLKEYFDEPQVLWGTKAEAGNTDFTVVADGSQGLRHAFPLKVEDSEFIDESSKANSNNKENRLRLLRLDARHYVDYDDDGCAYIALSRLVEVEVNKAKQDKAESEE